MVDIHGNERQVTHGPGLHNNPVWINGELLLYDFSISLDTNVSDVRVIDVNGKNEKTIFSSIYSAYPFIFVK